MNKAEPQPPAMLNRRAAIGATLVCIAAPVFGAAPVQAEPASAASKAAF